jgi:carboxyl-terminal processing protease
MTKVRLVLVRKILLASFLSAAIFIGGYFLGVSGFQVKLDKAKNIKIERTLPPAKAGLDFSLFWKVWDNLESQYFDKSKINRTDMVYGAIRGMVAALKDPYTVFLSPLENKVVQEDLSGSFEGVGIQIGFKGSQLAVIAPLPGSPAEKAGIKAGDFIVGIKDEAKGVDRGTVGLGLPEAVEIIRGKAGTKVTLLLTREGEEKPLLTEIVRAKLDVPSVILTFVGKEKKTAQLKVLKFNGDTLAEWDKEVAKAVKAGNPDGVILDLRNNPGGYMDGAVEIAAEFLPDNSLVVIEERAGGQRKEYHTERVGKLTEIPLVILVNEGSASAAEILAGALRDVRKVKIVGEKTFGKGTIQEPLQLNGGSGLHLTVAKWLTPNGTWVNEAGLEPDVKIKDDEKTNEDEQLQEALKLF